MAIIAVNDWKFVILFNHRYDYWGSCQILNSTNIEICVDMEVVYGIRKNIWP